MRSSDRAWMALAGGVTAYDLIAPDDEQLTNAARRVLQRSSANCHRVDDLGDSPASGRRHTAVVRSDHADVHRVSASCCCGSSGFAQKQNSGTARCLRRSCARLPREAR